MNYKIQQLQKTEYNFRLHSDMSDMLNISYGCNFTGDFVQSEKKRERNWNLQTKKKLIKEN